MKGQVDRFIGENRLVLFTALDSAASGTNSHIDDAIYQSIGAVSDWGYVLNHLLQHGTLITFNKHIERLQLWKHIPGDYAEQFSCTERVIRYRNRRFYEEIRKLSTLFREHDQPIFFIKGSMLILSGYYGPESRVMGDIDFIVPKQRDVAKARELLNSIGYTDMDRDNQMVQFNYKGEMQFINFLDREIMIELAVKLNKNYELRNCYPFKDEEIQDKTSLKVMDGIYFYEVEKEFHFAYCLFHHISLNYLHRLNWLNDLHLMITDKGMRLEKVNEYVKSHRLQNTWNLLNNILSHYFRISPCGGPAGRISPTLRKIYLDDSCHFVNLEKLEIHNVFIHFALIGDIWKSISVVLKKIFLPAERLKVYYKLDSQTSSFTAHYVHYKKSIQRFLRITPKRT